MASTTSTTLATLLPLITSEALFQANERSLLRGLVRNFNIPAGSGTDIKVPVYAKQAAAALTEGTAVTPAAITTGGATITTGEVGVATTVTDIARFASPSDVVSDLGKVFGEGIALKIDQDIAALFDGFGTTIGDGTAAITAANIFNAIAQLRSKSVPMSGMACVLHPEIAYDLKASITNSFVNPAGGAGSLANQAMTESFIGTLGGVPVFESAAITSSSGDSKGAVFHRDGLGLAMMQDIKIEAGRNVLTRGDDLVANAVYGVGELIDDYGVELFFDSSIAS